LKQSKENYNRFLRGIFRQGPRRKKLNPKVVQVIKKGGKSIDNDLRELCTCFKKRGCTKVIIILLSDFFLFFVFLNEENGTIIKE
jgi:hypothetical protein